jgi:hypothetical protein
MLPNAVGYRAAADSSFAALLARAFAASFPSARRVFFGRRLEAIFLSIFVLISQNRMSRLADRRSHLDLQIDLLAEQEVTTILRSLQRIQDHLGIQSPRTEEDEDRHLERTDVRQLVKELQQKLPEQ